MEFIPFALIWSWWGLCPAPSSLGLVFHRHQQHKRILSCVFQYCGGFHHCSLSVFCKGLLLASELPTFYAQLSLWAWILHRLVRWRIFHSIVWHCRASVFRLPMLASLFVELLWTSLTIYLATNDLASMLLAFVSAAPCTMKTHREVFHSILWTAWKLCPGLWQISVPINVPIIVNTAFLQHISSRTCCPGDIQIPSWNWEHILLSAHRVWLLVWTWWR